MLGLDAVREAATKYAINTDRAAYMWAFRSIEKTTAERGAAIAGNVGVLSLMAQKSDITDYTYEILIGGVDDVDAIHRALCDVHSDNTAQIAKKPQIDDLEYTIEINGRLIAKLYVLGKRGDSPVISTLTKVKCKSSVTGDDILAFGEEVALAGLARTLHNPSRAATWPAAFAQFTELMGRITRDSLAKRAFHGGRKDGRNKHKKHNKHNKPSALTIPSGCVLVGDHALRKLSLLENAKRHAQCVSSIPVKELAERMSKANGGAQFRVVKHYIGMPLDFQLVKYTIYTVLEDGGQRPALDVFNVTRYEMVPLCRTDSENTQIAGLFTILRLLLVDLWIMRMIRPDLVKRGGAGDHTQPSEPKWTIDIPEDKTAKVIANIILSIDIVCKAITAAKPESLWPASEKLWIGIQTLEAPAKKRMFARSNLPAIICELGP